MAIYEDIHRNAPNNDYVAAGHLHEQIWVRLLRLESPDLHNVRLGRGDGGIDGIEFLDPVLNTSHIYQAKFFKDLGEGRRKNVLDSFVAAHQHEFPCVKWTLLVPFRLSTPELNWLHVVLKKKAAPLLAKAQKGAAAACEIRYLDACDLEDRLERHLAVAGELLPDSVRAYQKKFQDERARTTTMERELSSRLVDLQDSHIREREKQSRQALAALAMLNQGWSNHVFALQSLRVPSRDERVTPEAIENTAHELVTFTESRMRDAYYAEGAGMGFASHVSRIHGQARILQAAAVAHLARPGRTDTISKIIQRIVDEIQELQRKVGVVLPPKTFRTGDDR